MSDPIVPPPPIDPNPDRPMPSPTPIVPPNPDVPDPPIPEPLPQR
ncbi:hypothetical protein [Desertimonas flava]|nr:hypothetical protein [Desertimonas flava]